MVLIVITDMFRCWMKADGSLITRLTLGLNGPHTTTKDIKGEVWQHPYHILLALPPWLEL